MRTDVGIVVRWGYDFDDGSGDGSVLYAVSHEANSVGRRSVGKE